MSDDWDIDLVGENPAQTGTLSGADVPPTDVPWNGEVVEGSLSGENPEPDFTPPAGEVFTDDLTAEAEAAEKAEYPGIPDPGPMEGEPGGTPLPDYDPANEETHPLPPEQVKGEDAIAAFEKEEAEKPPTPVKRSRRKKAAPKKKEEEAPEPVPEPKSKSGTIERLYRIFQIKHAEVDGNIISVPVPVTFTLEDESGKQSVLEGITARNRDIALTRAAKFFGPGWSGVLVAVPEGMWEPQPVNNVPDNSFSVKIGD
jgi:hypothetical protein